LHARRKKVSAYRVYKRETAPRFKAEYPEMKNSERQMIVREKWKALGEKEKLIFVTMAKIEEESLYYQEIKKFYDSRIQDWNE
jgi:hypothetical protein